MFVETFNISYELSCEINNLELNHSLKLLHSSVYELDATDSHNYAYYNYILNRLKERHDSPKNENLDEELLKYYAYKLYQSKNIYPICINKYKVKCHVIELIWIPLKEIYKHLYKKRYDWNTYLLLWNHIYKYEPIKNLEHKHSKKFIDKMCNYWNINQNDTSIETLMDLYILGKYKVSWKYIMYTIECRKQKKPITEYQLTLYNTVQCQSASNDVGTSLMVHRTQSCNIDMLHSSVLYGKHLEKRMNDLYLVLQTAIDCNIVFNLKNFYDLQMWIHI